MIKSELKQHYEAMRYEAAKLYVKDGLSADAICKQLNVSMPTLGKWKKAGRWDNLRPDMDMLMQYRAMQLYIGEGLDEGQIAQNLSVKAELIRMWILINGWQLAREIKSANNQAAAIVNSFCKYYQSEFPRDWHLVRVAADSFIRNLDNITYNNHMQ